MDQAKFKRIAAILVIFLTFAAFVIYFIANPAIWHELKQTPPSVLLKIFAMYSLSIVALTLVTLSTLRLCRLKIPFNESLMLTMYTAIVNFFGPLQSGPAFRGLYLKSKHKLSLKKYAVATSIYYMLWGIISLLLLFSGVLRFWLIPIFILVALSAILIERSKRYGNRFKQLDLRGVYWLVLATLLQILIVSIIYLIELQSIQSSISISQVLIYTGAANLALFVSITPGAIGFREAFLVFSQRLHHIDTSTIVAANTIDRAVYFVFLGFLAVYISAAHVSNKLNVKQITESERPEVL